MTLFVMGLLLTSLTAILYVPNAAAANTVTTYSPSGSTTTLDRGSIQAFSVTFSGAMDTTWSLDGVQVQSSGTVASSSWSHTFSTLGTYTVTATGTASGETLTQTWTVRVIVNFATVQTDSNLYMQPSQAWENGWIFDQTVWQDNGYYYMLYSGGPIGSRKIGFAWSTDGLNWNKDPSNPVLSPVAGTWESKEVFWASSVIKVSANTYWAYYQGQDTSGGMHSGVAFLTISGTTLTSVQRYASNPIVADTYELVVAKYSDTEWVGYNGYGHANLLLSSDGLNWHYVHNNVLVAGGYTWDNSIIYQQHAIIIGDTLYLMVVGNNQQLGMVYCKVGDWANLQYSPYNPIIKSGSGYRNYVLGGPMVYNPTLDSLDIWYSSVESLGGSGQAGFGFARVMSVTGSQVAPVISNPSPSNTATNILKTTSSMRFAASDPNGDSMTYTVTTSPNVGGASGATSGGQVTVPISGLGYGTTYQWTVSLSDGTLTTHSTYSFTTEPKPTFDPTTLGWTQVEEVTIHHTQVSSDQTNFPVLVSLTDSTLATYAQSNGNDILFMNNVGDATKLKHEIESYNPVTGQLTAWVNVPYVSSTVDTTIYMYFGNPTATNQQQPTQVWDTNYVDVLHLSDTGSTQYDSTIYQNNITPHSLTQGATGKTGAADSFPSSGTPWGQGSTSSSLSPTVLTVEAWIKPATLSGDHPIVEKYDYVSGKGGYIIRQRDNNLFFDVLSGTSDNLVFANGVLAVGNWYYVVGTFDGSTLKIYVNGQLINQAAWSGTNLPSSASLKLGTRGNDGPTGGGFFNGVIDEVRVSSVARSASYIATQYSSQSNPSAFCTAQAHLLLATPEYYVALLPFVMCFAAFLVFFKGHKLGGIIQRRLH